MQTDQTRRLSEIISKNEDQVLQDWIKQQIASLGARSEFLSEQALRTTSRDFLKAFVEAANSTLDVDDPAWNRVKSILMDVSGQRAGQGFTPVETAMFVFSLKQPIFEQLRTGTSDAKELGNQIWLSTLLIDKLGLLTTEVYQRSREAIIKRQNKELLELSSPVIKLWDKVLAVPIIGTLDSERTQTIMESLLNQIVETGSKIAILDITGVPTVDTQTAQHLIKTVAATRLMGAECLISGIRPQIAQTMVHLGIDIHDIITKATMADAVGEALYQLGMTVTKNA